MKTQYLPSFLKDIKSLKSTSSFNAVKTLVFQDIPNCQGLDEVRNLKKLKQAQNAYRIRVGDYRIGVFIEGNTIKFARVLHRREIYRYFP